jgi:hypothetical protein
MQISEHTSMKDQYFCKIKTMRRNIQNCHFQIISVQKGAVKCLSMISEGAEVGRDDKHGTTALRKH